MPRSNQRLLDLPESRQYAFLSAMAAGAYVSIVTLLENASFVKLIAFPYFLFASGMNYFFPIESCSSVTCNNIWFILTSFSLMFVMGLIGYLFGREKERKELF